MLELNLLNSLNKNKTIVSAISGGSDSMAQTLLLKEFADQKSIKLIAVTIDHGLRKDSATEAKQVGQWLKKHNIEHRILKWQGTKPDSNIQSNARDARYRLLIEFCQQINAPYLCIAHNKQDVAENLLIRLMRGSSVKGLSKIAKSYKINGITIIRPMLKNSREEIKQYLKSQNQNWIEDSSNEDEKYQRVKVRNFLKTQQDSTLLINRLNDTAQNMANSYDYILKKVREDADKVLQISEYGFCTIDLEKFKNLHPQAAYRILSSVIKHVGGNYYPPRFEKLQNLYDNILDNNIENTLGGCKIYQGRKKNDNHLIYIIRELSAIKDKITAKAGDTIIFDGRFKCVIKQNATISNIGKNGYAQIKDVANKTGMPKEVIYSLPCAYNIENITYTPYINISKHNIFTCEFIIELS